MEYRTPKSILILLVCWAFSAMALRSGALAAGSAGTSGADFLEIGVGSRPLGMGEAFTAATDDINSIYYNPAGLGTMRYPVASIMHQELILDSRFENISAAFPIFYGFMGVSNSIFWVPPFDKIDIDGNKTGTVTFYNACFTLAYGQSLGFMEVGGSVKYIHQKIDTLTLHSAAMDFGVLKRLYMYSPFDAPIRNFVLGMSLQNIGTKAKDDELPRLMRMGASYYLTRWFGVNLDVMQYFIDDSDLYDFTYGFEESLRANVGMELNYFNILALRGGYRFNDSGKYSLGMGFNYAVKDVGFSIDASYTDSGIFGPVYSFSITFKLIPKVITVEDQLKAEAHYQKAIKYYIANDIDSALDEFRSCRDYNPYHKNVKKKIQDLEYLKELKRKNEELDQRRTRG
ncbi:MAG TPA: PorV/PorQ family protein [Spirochaetota bacterium]|nr:PorV/PorQ family protein [Spirochaetota bacterium]